MISRPSCLKLRSFAATCVSADQNVDLAVTQARFDLLDVLCRAEPRDQLNVDRRVCKTVKKGPIMLLGEEGGGDEHGHPTVRHEPPERLPAATSVFPKPIAAHQAVHGPWSRHVSQNRLYGIELIRGSSNGKAAENAR